MAEGGDESDKTEEPTEHKLQEARKKGQIFKSQDVVSTAMLIGTAGLLLMTGSWMVREMMDAAKYWIGLVPDVTGAADLEHRNMLFDWIQLSWTFIKVLLPLLVGAFLVAVIANLAQVKFMFSTESLSPKLSKINPVEGFKRIFSIKSLVELIKQVVKLVIIAWICYKVVQADILQFQQSVFWTLPQTLAALKSVVVRIVSYVAIAMGAIAIVDYLFQRQQFMKQMRMSMHELKEEYKETEGNPQVKGKMRQLMRQGSQARMMEDVKTASAVITNPTHLAVAVRYEQGVTEAPVVVAKGERLVARQIKLAAADAEVPIVENVELARALYAHAEIGEQIPVDLFKAVAEVLAYLFKLKRKREQLRRRGRRAVTPPLRQAR